MIQWVSGTSPRGRRERLAGSLNDPSVVRCATQAGGTFFNHTNTNLN